MKILLGKVFKVGTVTLYEKCSSFRITGYMGTYMHTAACMQVELSTIHRSAFEGFQLTAISWCLFFLTPLIRGRKSVLDILRGS